MDSKPSQQQAHLMVAAVRVLAHKHARPPSVDEIAELLEASREVTGHQVRVLEKLQILRSYDPSRAVARARRFARLD